MKPVRTAARTLLSGIFLAGGARAVVNPQSLVAKASRVTDRIAPVLARADHRIPSSTEELIRVNGMMQLACGLLLATGSLTRPAAAVLAGTLVPTTVAGHPFWSTQDPQQRTQDRTHFVKNLGLLGGLLLVMTDTQGRPGLRWRTGHVIGHGRRSVTRMTRTARRGTRRVTRGARRGTRVARLSAAVARRLPG